MVQVALKSEQTASLERLRPPLLFPSLTSTLFIAAISLAVLSDDKGISWGGAPVAAKMLLALGFILL